MKQIRINVVLSKRSVDASSVYKILRKNHYISQNGKRVVGLFWLRLCFGSWLSLWSCVHVPVAGLWNGSNEHVRLLLCDRRALALLTEKYCEIIFQC